MIAARPSYSRVLLGRLNPGDDLLESLTALCLKEGVSLGLLEAIGAVRQARIGYYDQQKQRYCHRIFDVPLEIAGLHGNVSLKDGEPFVHAHVTFSDREGAVLGGHLASGTIVFACEFVLHCLEGADLERHYDGETGLYLWRGKEFPR